MSYFAPHLVTYTDATLAWDFDSFQALRRLRAVHAWVEAAGALLHDRHLVE